MLFMAVTGIAAYRSTSKLLEANDWVRHTYLVIGEAKDIRARSAPVRKRHAGDTCITGDAKYLEASTGLMTRLADSQKSIRMLTVDNPRQQSRLAVLGPLIDRRLADMTRISNIRKEKGFAASVVAGQQRQ